MNFHRFVMGDNPYDSGLISYASGIWNSDHELSDALDDAMKWFNHHLVAPKRVPNHGVFWFKDKSKFISKSKELQDIMRKNEFVCSHICCSELKKIWYEDKDQVIGNVSRRGWFLVE